MQEIHCQEYRNKIITVDSKKNNCYYKVVEINMNGLLLLKQAKPNFRNKLFSLFLEFGFLFYGDKL
jgi:hypothetical protein